MKTFVRLLALALCGLHLLAGQTAAKEAPKPSATVEALVKTLTEEQRTALLTLLNDGKPDALEAISGIGPARAAAIIQARPFAAVTDVMRVSVVGEGTFAKIIAHARAGFPAGGGGQKRPPAKPKSPAPAP